MVVKCNLGSGCWGNGCSHRKAHKENKHCSSFDCSDHPRAYCVKVEYTNYNPQSIKALKFSVALGIGIPVVIAAFLGICLLLSG